MMSIRCAPGARPARPVRAATTSTKNEMHDWKITPLSTRSESAVLTEARVKAARPRARRYTIADQTVPGLYLRVTPVGAKSWVVRGRVGGGRAARQRWVTVGPVAKVTLAEARTKAKALLGAMASGRDPKLECAAGETVKDALDRYERVLARRKIVKRADVVSSLRRNLARLHDVPVRELRREHIVGIMSSIADRGRPGAAAFFRKNVTAWMNLLVNDGVIGASPMAGYRDDSDSSRALRARRRERRTTYRLDELSAVCEALGEAHDPAFGDMLRICLLTGLRRGEAAVSRWDWIDGERLVVPGEIRKTGEPHIAHLGPVSLAVIGRQPRIAELIFQAASKAGRCPAGRSASRPSGKSCPASRPTHSAARTGPGSPKSTSRTASRS
jgi:integrase